MKLKLRDLIVIALIAVVSFPVAYLAMLFATGNARLELGPSKPGAQKREALSFMKNTARKDSLAAANSLSFTALQQERAQVRKERESLRDQQNRVTMLQQELESVKNELARKHTDIGKLVSESSELDKKRIRQLAKVYSAMRPAEAARILETLDDDLLVQILGAIGDDRQKAKILSTLSSDKAARVSARMGAPVGGAAQRQQAAP